MPHQELEKVLLQRMRTIHSLDDYIGLLQHFYRYFGALEDQINLYISSAELPDHMKRRKSENLAKDIRSLGGVLPEKAGLGEIPVIEDHLQAFGALYVMEGSTLGGRIISQMIAKTLGIGEEGLSFFQSYGEHLTAMWDKFRLTLNKQAGNKADAERIIATAAVTFQKFSAMFNQYE